MFWVVGYLRSLDPCFDLDYRFWMSDPDRMYELLEKYRDEAPTEVLRRWFFDAWNRWDCSIRGADPLLEDLPLILDEDIWYMKKFIQEVKDTQPMMYVPGYFWDGKYIPPMMVYKQQKRIYWLRPQRPYLSLEGGNR